MIFIFILQFVLYFINSLLFWLPIVDVLPLGMDSALVTAVSYFKSFMAIFPPLQIVWNAVQWYLGIILIMFLLRLFRIIR